MCPARTTLAVRLALAAACSASPVHAAGAGAAALLDGRTVVEERDLSDWQAAQGCYGEGALTSRKAAFMRLVEAAIAEEAMRANGGPALSGEDLRGEAARIDKETRAPDILSCIKARLGREERYLKVFVKPVLVESRLRAFLFNDPAVQGRLRSRAAAALGAARKGARLEEAAAGQGLSYSSATYSLAASSEPAGPEAAFEADFIRDRLRSLAPGELPGKPEETDYDIRLIRLLKTDGTRWSFETASARKTTQEEWFKSLRKMRLEIPDRELRGWALGIKGNPRLAAVEVR